MSTISRNAGTSLFGLYTSHSHLKRSSGTLTRACTETAPATASTRESGVFDASEHVHAAEV